MALALGWILREPYTSVVAFASDGVLRGLEPGEGEVLRVVDGGFELVTRLARRGTNERRVVEVERDAVTTGLWNSVVFLSLVLLTPLAVLRRRPARVALATAVLIAVHVAFTTVALLLLLEAEYAQAGVGGRGEGLLTALAGASHLYATVFAPALPFLLLAPVWLGRERRSRSPAAVGRNEPCPCGSGLKFKRCCGA